MKNDTHDNDNFDPWSSIGLAASMILNRLQNQRALLELADKEHEQSNGNAGSGRAEKENSKDHGEYVETRLRELRSWERRISGNKRPVTETTGVDQTNAGRMVAGRLK